MFLTVSTSFAIFEDADLPTPSERGSALRSGEVDSSEDEEDEGHQQGPVWWGVA